MEPLLAIVRRHAQPLEPQPTGQTAVRPHFVGLRAVLFDVYGTLFVSAAGEVGTVLHAPQAGALRAALGAIDAEGDLDEAAVEGARLLPLAIAREQARRRAEGCAVPEIEIRRTWAAVLFELRLRGLLREIPTADRIEHLAVEFESRVNPVWPMPGAADTLARLRAQGLRLGIVSNAQFFTPLLFGALLGAAPDALGFDPDACAWSYRRLEAKPAPGLFDEALAALRGRHGIEPGEVLYVGNDLLNDIWAARQAGCRTALFAGDCRSLRLREDEPRCAGLRPDAVLTALDQLPGLLDGG